MSEAIASFNKPIYLALPELYTQPFCQIIYFAGKRTAI